METVINTIKYAKLLKERRAELLAERKTALVKYKKDLADWRFKLGEYVERNARSWALGLKQDNLKDWNRYGHSGSEGLLINAPKPPVYPSDDLIRNIDAALRHLAITGREKVKLDTSEVKKYLVGKEEDDD